MKLKLRKEILALESDVEEIVKEEILDVSDEEESSFGMTLDKAKKVEYIVKAVNNYDRLQAREKKLEESIDIYRKQIKGLKQLIEDVQNYLFLPHDMTKDNLELRLQRAMSELEG